MAPPRSSTSMTMTVVAARWWTMLVPALSSCPSPSSSASTTLVRYRDDESSICQAVSLQSASASPNSRKKFKISGAPPGPRSLRFVTRVIGMVTGFRLFCGVSIEPKPVARL